MNPAETLRRWLGVASEVDGSRGAARDRLGTHCAAPPTSADPAEHRRWLATKRELEDEVAAEEAALRIAEAEVEKARAAASDAEDRAVVTAFNREKKAVRADILKVLDLSTEIAKLIPKIEAHVDLAPEVAKLAKRLGLPAVVDAERELREVPGHTVEAKYQDVEIWEDAQGRRPMVFKTNRAGELEPQEAGFQKKTVRELLTRGQEVPPRMPDRLASAIKLVGLHGEPLWPPR